jgi:uncharacterized membrane protein (UPF0127 family)
MAILTISEFVERAEVALVQCTQCKGIMFEQDIQRLDALIFVFGKRTLPRRYRCADCGYCIKK